ncbi:MAG: tetratricopeptide repeat protein [Blastocatellia bacterium]
MKLNSHFLAPIVICLAMAGVSSIAGSGRCLTGQCRTIPMPGVALAGVPSLSALVQQGPGRGKVTPGLDPELELQYTKSLEAAWFYYKKRLGGVDQETFNKRLANIEERLQEILDVYPAFTRLSEVYFLMGEVNRRKNDRIKAIDYYSRVVKEYVDSPFAKDAKKRLEELGVK